MYATSKSPHGVLMQFQILYHSDDDESSMTRVQYIKNKIPNWADIRRHEKHDVPFILHVSVINV